MLTCAQILEFWLQPLHIQCPPGVAQHHHGNKVRIVSQVIAFNSVLDFGQKKNKLLTLMFFSLTNRLGLQVLFALQNTLKKIILSVRIFSTNGKIYPDSKVFIKYIFFNQSHEKLKFEFALI